MRYQGRAWKFGAHVDTDAIIPARYLNESDPESLARHCMEDENPRFVNEAKQGDIIVAGTNFGCGSSREHAPIAIKARGIPCVIAASFARIFYRNAFNMGLPILESSEAAAGVSDGDTVAADLSSGKITNLTTGAVFSSKPIPPFMEQIVRDGGLMGHIAKSRQKGKDRNGEAPP